MIGSYVVFVTVSTMGLPPMAGVLLAVAVCTLLGMTIERIAYKPLRGASPVSYTHLKYIGENKLASKVAVIYDSSDVYSSGIYEKFAEESANQGIEIVAAEAFTADSNKDFSTCLLYTSRCV